MTPPGIKRLGRGLYNWRNRGRHKTNMSRVPIVEDGKLLLAWIDEARTQFLWDRGFTTVTWLAPTRVKVDWLDVEECSYEFDTGVEVEFFEAVPGVDGAFQADPEHTWLLREPRKRIQMWRLQHAAAPGKRATKKASKQAAAKQARREAKAESDERRALEEAVRANMDRPRDTAEYLGVYRGAYKLGWTLPPPETDTDKEEPALKRPRA